MKVYFVILKFGALGINHLEKKLVFPTKLLLILINIQCWNIWSENRISHIEALLYLNFLCDVISELYLAGGIPTLHIWGFPSISNLVQNFSERSPQEQVPWKFQSKTSSFFSTCKNKQSQSLWSWPIFFPIKASTTLQFTQSKCYVCFK